MVLPSERKQMKRIQLIYSRQRRIQEGAKMGIKENPKLTTSLQNNREIVMRSLHQQNAFQPDRQSRANSTNILSTKENASPEVPKIKLFLTMERCNRLCGNCALHGSFASMKNLLLRILFATFRMLESGIANNITAELCVFLNFSYKISQNSLAHFLRKCILT